MTTVKEAEMKPVDKGGCGTVTTAEKQKTEDDLDRQGMASEERSDKHQKKRKWDDMVVSEEVKSERAAKKATRKTLGEAMQAMQERCNKIQYLTSDEGESELMEGKTMKMVVQAAKKRAKEQNLSKKEKARMVDKAMKEFLELYTTKICNLYAERRELIAESRKEAYRKCDEILNNFRIAYA